MFECARGRCIGEKYAVGGGNRLVPGENGIPPRNTVVGDEVTNCFDGLPCDGGLARAGL
jgi:hypothetical protein